MNEPFHLSAKEGAKTVNPRWHDEFVALCALFPTGELTEEEWALLQIHLAYCDSCLLAFQEYQLLADHVLPMIAASAGEERREFSSESSSFSLETAQVKLVKALAALETGPKPQTRRNMMWLIPAGIVAAGLAIVSYLALQHPLRLKIPSPESATHRPSPSQTLPRSIDLRPDLEVAQHENLTLQKQLGSLEEQYRVTTSAALNLDEQLKSELTEKRQAVEQIEVLKQQLAVEQTETQSLRDKLSATATIDAEQSERASNLEAKLRDLNALLEDKDRALALDKEFLAHDRDIRDLIGARDLYIADIYDVAKNGQTAKPFGRVFYTKGRSLIFYGYDLDKQPGLKQSVTFQAWGSSDSEHKQAVSLGMFYQDETNKRWVLRFDDTKTLARLNLVFVTAEPAGGSSKPTGKPLLMAYLQMQANHP